VSTVEYKGYQGEVSYEDGRLRIQVLHVSDFLTAECDSASEIKNAFHALIDEYLAQCADLGVKPDKPFKGSFNVRLPSNMHRRAAMAATRAGQSLNAWIGSAVKSKLEGKEPEGKDGQAP
jgi:predicted HicB family RNase H-like nuclease